MIVDVRRFLAPRRRMSRFASGGSLLVERLAILVLASKRSRLSGRGAVQLLDSILERLDELAQARILGFELLNALIARIGVHAATPGTRVTTCHREHAPGNRRAQVQFNFNGYPRGR